MVGFAMLLIATIIGAGFATGAEIVTFFGKSSLSIFIIALIATLFLFVIMYALLQVSIFNREEQQRKGENVATTATKFKHLFTLSAYIFYMAMIAGVRELSGDILAIVATLFCIFMIWLGFDRLVAVNKFLIFAVLVILITSALPHLTLKYIPNEYSSNVGRTIIMAIFYAGMNCCMLEAVFSKALDRWSARKLTQSCIVACSILGVLIWILLSAIRNQNVSDEVMPVLAISPTIITKTAIFLSILTSMFGALLNIANTPKKAKSLRFLLIVSAIAYAFSLLGFRTVVSIVYPIIGGIMLFYVIWRCCSVYQHTRAHQSHRQPE